MVVFLFLQYVEPSHVKLDNLQMQDAKDKARNAAAKR